MNTLILVPSEFEWSLLVGDAPVTALGPLRTAHAYGLTWALCGVGPAAAAVTTTLLLQRLAPERVVLVGVGGAYPESGLAVGDLITATEEVFVDLGYEDHGHWRNLDHMNLGMLATVDGVLGCTFALEPMHGDVRSGRFLTVSSVTNSHERAHSLAADYQGVIENMEGAGVATACALFNTPLTEFRAVSNLVGPRDPKSWRLKEPLAQLLQVLTATFKDS